MKRREQHPGLVLDSSLNWVLINLIIFVSPCSLAAEVTLCSLFCGSWSSAKVPQEKACVLPRQEEMELVSAQGNVYISVEKRAAATRHTHVGSSGSEQQEL